MKKIRTIIIEDEFKPREALKSKLEKHHQDIDIVAMCGNSDDGFEKIVLLKPDLLFLDIEMPGRTGIELLQLLKEARITLSVIIITAYSRSEYYRKAMYLSAVDFLIKPVIADELAEALIKVRERMEEVQLVANKQISQVSFSSRQFEFNCPVGKLFLNEDQIVYVKAEGNYSRIFLSDAKNELVTESMKQLELKFSNSPIKRVDRSHFVNKFYVQKIATSSNRCHFLSSVGVASIELNETGVKNLMKG